MENIVEDVEDQRQTKGSPADSQGCKNLVVWDVLRHSSGVNQSGVIAIRSQHDQDIETEAK